MNNANIRKKMKKTHKFNLEDIEKIQKLTKFGFKTSEIATFFNVNNTSIFRVLQKHGSPARFTMQEILEIEINKLEKSEIILNKIKKILIE
jgi:hypothetical protein